MTNKPRVVVCAANRHTPTGYVVCSARHYDDNMLRQMLMMNKIPWKDAHDVEQGFIDQFGTFMTRRQAHRVATEAGQIKYRCGGDTKELFSENLY